MSQQPGKSFPIDIAIYAKMSQQEARMDAQLRQKQQQYYAQKKARKKEILKLKKQQFGLSSSDEEEISSPKNQQQALHNDEAFLKNEIVQKQTKIAASGFQTFIVSCYSGNEWAHNTELKFKNQFYFLLGKQRSYEQLVSLKIPTMYKAESNPTIQLNQKGQPSVKIMVPKQKSEKELSSHYIIVLKMLQMKHKQSNSKISQQNLQKFPQKLILNSDVYGYLFKKSQVLGRWQKRFIVSNKQGLFSYKNVNEKPTMAILWQQVKQISTKFQSYYQGIVITIHYNTSQTSIAIPIVEPLQAKSKQNWLYAIYRRALKWNL